MAWKTIDTVPKDGRSIILGWAPNGPIEYQAGSSWRNGRWTGNYIDATHWRPAEFDSPPVPNGDRDTQGERQWLESPRTTKNGTAAVITWR